MKNFPTVSASLFISVAAVGCTINMPAEQPAPQPAVVAASGPVVNAPGVTVIAVEPPPPDRVYIYDVGYPPGTYLYGGNYYYNGYYYPHDVFVNQYVVENVRYNRYTNVVDNRRAGAAIVRQQQADYQRTGGHPTPATMTPAKTTTNRPPPPPPPSNSKKK